MNQKVTISPAAAPPAVGPYNHGVRFGNLLFSSGQIPLNAQTPDAPFPQDIREQTEQVLKNMETILTDQGLGLAHVLKTTIFLTDLAHFQTVNEVYGRFFPSDYPARSCVQVTALPKGASVEIEFVAGYPE